MIIYRSMDDNMCERQDNANNTYTMTTDEAMELLFNCTLEEKAGYDKFRKMYLQFDEDMFPYILKDMDEDKTFWENIELKYMHNQMQGT